MLPSHTDLLLDLGARHAFKPRHKSLSTASHLTMASEARPTANNSSPTCDILIVGAGIAGLACGRTLAEQGLRVCIVEAGNRIGGRILTERLGDQIVELGAEFIHGRPPELLALIAEAGLTICERDGSQLSFEDCRLTADSEGRDSMFDPIEQLRDFPGPDLSFSDFLAHSSFASNPDLRAAATGYVEGFNAADAGQISALSLGIQQAAEDSIDGDHIAHIREGYDRLPQFLADRLLATGGTLHLGTRVQAVHWATGRVALGTTAGEFTAAKAVLTLPLGILQAGSVHIVPELPAIAAAAALMRMGPVCRFTLVFHEPFWQTLPPPPNLAASDLHDLNFLFDFGELPSVWWSTHPERTPANTTGRTLTGWVGGPRATSLLASSSADLATLGCRALARIFNQPESRLHQLLEACLTHNWSADGDFQGSYSYVGVGGAKASARLAQPVEHTVFFAGEHTDTTGHWGTVHGALRSGLRAASQILDSQ